MSAGVLVMDITEFDKYVGDRYQSQIQWYDNKSRHNQRMYRVLQWILIVFSALTPVLLALDFCLSNSRWQWIPLISAIIVALTSTALKVFKYQENWIDYRTTAETLKKEIHFYRSHAQEYAQADDRERLFVERVESLISRENTLWLSRHEGERGDERN